MPRLVSLRGQFQIPDEHPHLFYYYWDALIAILTNKIEIEKHKAKLQINI